jgi:hypothetical protein
MPLAPLAPVARQRAVSDLGSVSAGAKLYTYEAGTTTPLATYTDSGLSVANANPQIASAGGLFGPIYLQPQAYKFVLYDANDLLIFEQDDVSDVATILNVAVTALQDQVDAGSFPTLTVTAMPTSDPAVAGQLWNDGGTVKISAG